MTRGTGVRAGIAANGNAGAASRWGRRIWLGCGLALGAAIPAGAAAQVGFAQGDTTLVKPAVPEGFDRGRNVSVVEKQRPEFDALGLRYGSFKILPKIATGAGVTSNPFLVSNGARADGFAYVDPSLVVASDWSRHALTFYGDADLQRYFSDSRRNQTAWNADLSGKVELGDAIQFDGEAQVSRQYESPFTGDVQSSLAVVSNYLRTYFKGRAVYERGRGRAQIVIDRTDLDFANLEAVNGSRINQDARDRGLTRINAQVDYALSPSISLYGQGAYDAIGYDNPIAPGIPNRDSKGTRAIVGVNFDLTSFLRGSIGVGYTRRDFDSSRYRTVDGASAEALIEYFPSELTTVTLRLRRFLEDSSIFSNTPFFDNRASLRVDHELLTNLLLNASFEVAKIDYLEDIGTRDFYRAQGGAKYMISPDLALQGAVSWGRQSGGRIALGQNFSETRGQIGVVFQR